MGADEPPEAKAKLIEATPEKYTGKLGTYGDAFKIYEDGKHRRYSLLFAVNGGVAAIVKLYDSNGVGLLERKSVVAVGMVVFTLLMGYDIWIFGDRIRKIVGDAAGSADKGIFSSTGKQVLSGCCLLLVAGWTLVLIH